MPIHRVTLALLAVLASAGCAATAQTDCMHRCEGQRREGCTPLRVTDCEAYCDSVAALYSRTGCADEHGAFERCAASGDPCDTTGRCDAEGVAILDCVRVYCDTGPDDPGICGP